MRVPHTLLWPAMMFIFCSKERPKVPISLGFVSGEVISLAGEMLSNLAPGAGPNGSETCAVQSVLALGQLVTRFMR